MVFDGDPHGKMVEALKLVVSESQEFVNGIVEVATNPRGASTSCFGFQIQDLADHSCLPKQVSVEPSPVSLNRLGKLGNHAEAEETIRGDVLMATQGSRSFTEIPFF
jgi:hypothetical protein